MVSVSDEVAARLIAKILDMKDYSIPLYIYPKQLSVLRSLIGTLIHYAFVLR